MDRLQEVMMVKSKADIITGQHRYLATDWETIGHVTFYGAFYHQVYCGQPVLSHIHFSESPIASGCTRYKTAFCPLFPRLSS